MSSIKIALVGDDKATFESIKTYFSSKKDFSVVLESNNVKKAMFEFEGLALTL